ncbi:MAG: hypothetical protein E6G56_08860 [Actinobacteria bacterium]|nr:MAG: hypothetical protein E6G56_08860 [Actinomycetota bacterium]
MIGHGWPRRTSLPPPPPVVRSALVLAILTPALGLLVPAAPAGAYAGPGLPTAVQDDAHLQYARPGQVHSEVGHLRALGVDRVRLTASWANLTRSPNSRRPPDFDSSDPAQYQQDKWRHLDTAVREADQAGLGVMIDIGFWAPRWAARGPGPRFRSHVDSVEYARFAQAIARRYSGSFIPPPEAIDPLETSDVTLPAAQSFELWNEPNHPAFLAPQWYARGSRRTPASPVVYRAMVQRAYPAIKSANPHAAVLIGNTSSRGGFGGPHDSVPPLRFLRELACVDSRLRPVRVGACTHYRRLEGDGWAHHPYSLTGAPSQHPRRPDEVLVANLSDLAATLDRLVSMGRIAPGLRNIYVTEYGYETKALPHRPSISESTQGRYLTWGEYLAWRVPTVRLFSQFLLRDQPPSRQVTSDSPQRPHGQFYSGLEHSDGTPKLAERSFLAGLFARRTSSARVLLWGRLRLRARSVRVSVESHLPGQAWQTLSTSDWPSRSAEASFALGGHGVFERWVPYVARVRYRLRYRLPDGAQGISLPVPVIWAAS